MLNVAEVPCEICGENVAFEAFLQHMSIHEQVGVCKKEHAQSWTPLLSNAPLLCLKNEPDLQAQPQPSSR